MVISLWSLLCFKKNWREKKKIQYKHPHKSTLRNFSKLKTRAIKLCGICVALTPQTQKKTNTVVHRLSYTQTPRSGARCDAGANSFAASQAQSHSPHSHHLQKFSTVFYLGVSLLNPQVPPSLQVKFFFAFNQLNKALLLLISSSTLTDPIS